MPQVSVNYAPDAYQIEQILDWLHDNLPYLITEHLGVPESKEASLSLSEVGFEDPRPFGPRTVSTYVFEIMIMIHDYEDRKPIHKSGCQALWDAIAEVFKLRDGRFYIWSPLGQVFIDKRAEPEALPDPAAS